MLCTPPFTIMTILTWDFSGALEQCSRMPNFAHRDTTKDSIYVEFKPGLPKSKSTIFTAEQ